MHVAIDDTPVKRILRVARHRCRTPQPLGVVLVVREQQLRLPLALEAKMPERRLRHAHARGTDALDLDSGSEIPGLSAFDRCPDWRPEDRV